MGRRKGRKREEGREKGASGKKSLKSLFSGLGKRKKKSADASSAEGLAAKILSIAAEMDIAELEHVYSESGGSDKALYKKLLEFPKVHEKLIRSHFPEYEFVEDPEKLEENPAIYKVGDFFTITPEEREEYEDSFSLFYYEDGKKVLGLYLPIAHISSNITFDKIVFVSTKVYNFFYQKSSGFVLASKEGGIDYEEDILQFMESAGINDLHIQALNEYQYEITARVGQKIIKVSDPPIPKALIDDLLHQSLLAMGKDTLVDPPSLTGLSQHRLISSEGMPIERTFRVNMVTETKNHVKTKGVSIRRLMNVNDISKLGFKGLGYTDDFISIIERIKMNKDGTIIIVGATNSGKSTLMAMIMLELFRMGLRIKSIENPIEISMPYSQIDLTKFENASEKNKLTRERAIAEMLRQDPDVIAINEIRYEQEINDFVSLGLKGHLAFTTLHANDVITAMLRLLQGSDKLDVSSSLRAIIAQTLVDKICTECRNDPVAKEKCRNCGGKGFKGVVPVYEVAYFHNIVPHRDDILDIGRLVDEGKVIYMSKSSLAKMYYERGIIDEIDYNRIVESETSYDDIEK